MWTFTASNYISVPLQGSVLDAVFIICVLGSCRDTLSRNQLFENEKLYQIVFIILALLKKLGLVFLSGSVCVGGWIIPVCREQVDAGGIFFHSPVQLRLVYHKDQWRNININLFSVAWLISQTSSILNPTGLTGNFFHPQSQAGLWQPNDSKGPGSFVGENFKFDTVTKSSWKLELFK